MKTKNRGTMRLIKRAAKTAMGNRMACEMLAEYIAELNHNQANNAVVFQRIADLANGTHFCYDTTLFAQN